MPIPNGYPDFATWLNDVGSQLNVVAGDFSVFLKYWSSLTAAQKTQLKNLLLNKLDATSSSITDIKSYIQNETP